MFINCLHLSNRISVCLCLNFLELFYKFNNFILTEKIGLKKGIFPITYCQEDD